MIDDDGDDDDDDDDDEPRQLKELQNGPCPNDEDVAHLAAKQAGAVSRDI